MSKPLKCKHKVKHTGVEVYISTTELNSMLKAQKRKAGFRDIAEVYGTFWLDVDVAHECDPRGKYKKFRLTE